MAAAPPAADPAAAPYAVLQKAPELLAMVGLGSLLEHYQVRAPPPPGERHEAPTAAPLVGRLGAFERSFFDCLGLSSR